MLEVVGLHRQGLSPVSFRLEFGECLAVRGPSGSGKTLMLRAIADLDPNEGEVRLDGQRRDAMPAPHWRRLVGYLPAEPGWWGETVGEHFADWAVVVPLVRRLGLPDEAASWPIARPSTGERLRLALVRALAIRPRILMLDEPTAALDSVAAGIVESLIAEQVAAGLGVLWVTHDASQGERIARRRLVVAKGEVHEELAA